MEKFFSPFKVGILVILSFSSFLYMFGSVKKGISDKSGSYKVHFFLKDATGLSEKSKVQIAGINIGEIKKISLDKTGTKAKIVMVIRGDIVLKTDATVMKKNSSILGDSYIELTAGVLGEPLKNGMEIKNIRENASIGGMMNKFDSIAADISEMTKELKSVVTNKNNIDSIESIIKQLENITKKLDEVMGRNNKKIDLILDNITTFTKDISKLTPQYRRNIQNILNSTDKTINSVKKLIDNNKDYLASILSNVNKILNHAKGKMGKVRDSVDNFEKITDNLVKISDDINEGKGTVGALIKSEKVYNDISDVMGAASDFAYTYSGIRTIIDAHSEYLFRKGAGYHDFGVRFQPKRDKYYYIGVTSSPFDVLTSSKKTSINQDQQSSYIEEKVYEDTLSFTLYMALSFHFLTFKYGIFESNAGAGMDFNFISNQLILSSRINEFTNETPNLRLGMRYYFWKQFYINMGTFHTLDDERRDFFMGLGATFNDRDLKSIFSAAPSISP